MRTKRNIRSVLAQYLPPKLLIRMRALDNYYFGAAEISYLKYLCQPDRTSIDIGANIGVYTYFMRKYSKHVYAYEPNPGLVRLLEHSFDDRVSVVPAALSSSSGLATLKMPVDQGVEMHGLASLSQEFSGAEDVTEFEVPLRRLDDENYDNVGFIKIDVEQHEEEVLKGAMETIAAQRPNLLIEVTPLIYEQSLAEVFASLLSLGYHAFFLFDGTLVSLSSYDAAVHNRTENLGNGRKFVGNLMFSMNSSLT